MFIVSIAIFVNWGLDHQVLRPWLLPDLQSTRPLTISASCRPRLCRPSQASQAIRVAYRLFCCITVQCGCGCRFVCVKVPSDWIHCDLCIISVPYNHLYVILPFQSFKEHHDLSVRKPGQMWWEHRQFFKTGSSSPLKSVNIALAPLCRSAERT